MDLSRVKEVAKKKGYVYVVQSGIRISMENIHRSINKDIFRYCYHKIFKSMHNFNFNGKNYRYFYHRYNTTWKNERTVEIPIIREIMNKKDPSTILEVGNVLSHYFPVTHDIVDKYEEGKCIINCDMLEFQSSKKYNLIVSISTLEHVGWDEYIFNKDVKWDKNSLDQTKIPHVIEKMKTLLVNKGEIVVTLPVGYNKVLDKLLKENKIHFTEIYCLKRISNDNKFIEADWE